LTGCGGGSGEAAVAPTPIEPIVVNAGQNISVAEQTLVEVSGSASGGIGAYTYAWQLTPTVIINDEDPSDSFASFTSPVVAQDSTYQLTLSVTDERGNTGSDTVILNVNAVNLPPVAVINVAQDAMYAVNQFPILSDISLSAAQSFDADPQGDNIDSLTYSWRQISGEQMLGNAQLNRQTLQFESPLSQTTQTIEIELMVTDQEGAVDTATVALELLSLDQTVPSIAVGKGMTVFAGEKINLSALATTKAPNAQPFLYRWTVLESQPALVNAVVYADRVARNTFAVAPKVEVASDLTFEVNASDRYGNRAQNIVQIKVLPTTQLRVNDTGVFWDANQDTNTLIYQGEYAGQDAHRGTDAVDQNGLSIKAGRGQQGFDFTRLNQNGDEVDDINQPWRCVRDNVTGLVWENKTVDDVNGLHYAQQLFTWYDEGENGGFAGHINPSSMSCNLPSGNCNTQAFVSAVNDEGLCGFFDWRMPSHSELMSIVHYGKSRSPLIDQDYFVHNSVLDQQQVWYWTLQSSVDGTTDAGTQNAWAFDFATGVDNFLNKASQQRVRLVRAGR